MKISLVNRWVWITGASSGLGRWMALHGADRGARLLLSGRNTAALAQTATDAQARSLAADYPGGHDVLAFDLADREARRAATREAVRRTGGFALVFLNAGISQRSGFEQLAPEAFERIVDLDLLAPVDVVRELLPSMARGTGLVFISSVAGLFGAPRRSAYSAAKHGLKGFAEVLRGEVYRRGVSVTTVFPGYVRTGIDKAALGPDGRPQGEDDPNIQNGADPNPVARRIVAAAMKGRPNLRVAVGPEARLGAVLSRWAPRLYARIASGRG